MYTTQRMYGRIVARSVVAAEDNGTTIDRHPEFDRIAAVMDWADARWGERAADRLVADELVKQRLSRRWRALNGLLC